MGLIQLLSHRTASHPLEPNAWMRLRLTPTVNTPLDVPTSVAEGDGPSSSDRSSRPPITPAV